MKKGRIITLSVILSAFAFAGDYAVNVSVPAADTVVVTKVATTATVDSITVNLRGVEPTYSIRIVLKDADGVELSRKTARITNAQMKTLMPTIDDIMAGGRTAMAANMESILALAN